MHRLAALFVVIVSATTAPLAANDWPEWRGAGRLGVWTDTGVLDKFPAGGLTPPGACRSGAATRAPPWRTAASS